MSISIAQQKGNSSGSTSSLILTFTNPTVNGNGIVVCIGSVNRATNSVTDDAGNTYTKRRTANFFSSPFAEIWDCTSISGNPTAVTVGFSTGTKCSANAYEVNGSLTAHAGNSNSANATNGAAGSFSTTTGDTIAFACLQDNTVSAAPTGYNLDQNAQSNGVASKIYTTTQSSINPAWSNSTGGYAASIEAYTSTNTGGVVLNKSVTSTATFTETQTVATVLVRSISESLTFTETQTLTDSHRPSVTSTLTLSETQVTQNVLLRTTSETLTLTESVALNTVLNESVSSALTLTETQTTGDVSLQSINETLTLSEAQIVVTALVRSVSETLTLISTPSVETVISIAVGESFHLVGTASPNIVSSQEVDQTISFSGNVQKTSVQAVNDTLTFSQVAGPINQVFNITDNTLRQKTPISSTTNNGSTLTITFPSPTLLNDGIVLCIGNQVFATTISSITDNAGNTYSLLQDANTFSAPRSRIYYCSAALPLTTITLHLSTTGSTIGAIAYEVNGSITADAGNHLTQNASPQDPGAITTAASTLVFALDTNSLNPSAPAGWTDDGIGAGVRFIHNIYSSVQTGLDPAFVGSSLYAAAQQSFTTANRGGVHSTLTLTSTQSETHVSNPFLSQNLGLAQPNRIPLTYTLNRSFNQSLTLTETITVTSSKHAESALTFSQDQSAEVVKTAKGVLEFDQSATVELVLNRTLISLLEPFHTVVPGPNILNESIGESLTLASIASGYATKPVSEVLTFSQVVVGVASKAVKETLTFTQTIKLNKSLGVKASSAAHLVEAIHTNVSKAVSAHSYFGFNGFAKGVKSYTVNVNNTLTLTSLGTRERHVEVMTDPLTLSQVIESSRVTNLTVAEILQLIQTPRVSISKAVNITNTLTFLNNHNRYLADLVFQVPNIQYLISEPYTILRGADQIVVLPNPQFGDGQGNTGEFTVRFAINGQSYSYVKNNNTSKLNYSFYLSRSKCRELQRFLQVYQAKLVELQNWKGEIWKVYITNNPFETTSVSMYTNGKPTNEERWDISLEFEGIRMN